MLRPRSAHGPLGTVLALTVLGTTLILGGARASAASADQTVRIGINEKDAAIAVAVKGMASVGGASLGLSERGAVVRLAGPAACGPLAASSWLARAMAAEMSGAGLETVVWSEVGGFRAASGPFDRVETAAEAAAAADGAGLPVRLGAVADGRREALGLEVVTAEGASSGLVSGPVEVTRSGPGDLRVGGRRYRGDFAALRDPQGLLSGVNRLPLEEYLRGVVPEEMPVSWPLEALKAQAVAARTYALANLGGFANYGYDLSATTRSQAYGGQDSEQPAGDAAVGGTRGLVATYDGRLISTYYHAHAGGRTDSAIDVWGFDVPYLRGVAVTYERPYPWAVVYTRGSLGRLVNGLLPQATDQAGATVGSLLRVIPGRPTPGGRALDVTLVGTLGRYTVSSERLRGAVGATRMKSLMYEVRTWPELTIVGAAPGGATVRPSRFVARVGGRPTIITLADSAAGAGLSGPAASLAPAFFVIEGQGYGHGIGLSQWGAYEMATRGFTYQAILSHFYQGIKVEPYRPGR